MMDGLVRLQQVIRDCESDALPVIETQHRALAGDPCHFTAPASLPDDPAQPSGRVLGSASRLVFIGGGRTSGTPWHAVHQAVRLDRDVLLVRADGSAVARYRFNTFADALIVVCLARHFRAAKGRRL